MHGNNFTNVYDVRTLRFVRLHGAIQGYECVAQDGCAGMQGVPLPVGKTIGFLVFAYAGKDVR